MKKYNHLFVLYAFIMFVFSSCEDKTIERYTVNAPVYLSYEDLRSSVKSTTIIPEIAQPGKIYFYNDYIFINEYQKGVHVIDNSDPSSPQTVTFINIPGNVDIAIKSDILYADSYVDLVVIDISDLNNVIERNRIINAFPYTIPEVTSEGRMDMVDESKGVVVGWEEKEVEVKVENNNYYNFYPVYAMEDVMIGNDVAVVTDISGGKNYGVGGSMARFTIYNDVLYAINEFNLNIFDISDLINPNLCGTQYVGWNIETIFPYKKKLFIGSGNGMFIYSLQNPKEPTYISSYSHVSSCDPVVVENDYAYVTLRSGNECAGYTDQLDVVDLKNINNPELLISYSMFNPHGLGINNGTLFICDGDSGLKIYDATDPLNIDENMITHFKDIHAFDVIPLDDILMMIGRDGFYQYDYSDLDSIKLLSTISILNN
ncbi:MAG: hypothetical protein JXB49_02910 [Bacteroidales bacterium]|nr:hypothetical protein [Bacteroidales bacterium]